MISCSSSHEKPDMKVIHKMKIFVVTTPTQPQLNLIVGFDEKITLHHPPPTTTRNSMSAISQLILTRF